MRTSPLPDSPLGLTDEAGVQAAYQAHGAELYRFVLRGLGDAGAAQDVVQETFLRAWRAADRYDESLASLRVWLFAIARNAMIDHARASSRRPWQGALIDPTELREAGDASVGVDDGTDALLRSWLVEEALTRISPEHRAAIVETHLKERPYAEVAAEHGIPVGTLRSRVFYGLKALRLAMDEMGSDAVTDPTALPEGHEPSPRELVHRALREQLGTYSLGQLGEVESAAVAAHLDGCASCREELAEIAPLLGDLRLVDAGRLEAAPTPPPDLGARIVAAVTAERALVARRARRRVVGRALALGAAASLVLAVGVGVGTQVVEPREVTRTITRTVTPPVPSQPAGPYEAVRWAETAVDVTKVGLVPHTWGVEVKLEGSGFVAGEVYRAVVRTKRGRDLAAGEFLGTGDRKLVCNMQAAVLRDAASGFSIVDSRGVAVVQSRFPVL